MEKQDGPFGKTYVPKVGEECITSEDLAERPSVIFIPFYLWTVICQRCGEFLVLVANADAQSFVKTHNKICSKAGILKEEG